MSQAVRLQHRWEFSLDARQVFYVLFGVAILATLLFVLGLLIGKRLEARAVNRSLCGASLDDLDRFVPPNVDFTFHKVLVHKMRNPNLPPEVYETAHMDEPGAPGQGVGRTGAGQAGDEQSGKVIGLERQKGQQRAGSETGAAAPRPERARFTLQVGSFRSRTEAAALLGRLRKDGTRAYLVAKHLRGRGTWYRVRMGRFATWKQALRAKARFEKAWHKTAYVTRLR